MMEGSGAGSALVTNVSGYGSGRQKKGSGSASGSPTLLFTVMGNGLLFWPLVVDSDTD